MPWHPARLNLVGCSYRPSDRGPEVTHQPKVAGRWQRDQPFPPPLPPPPLRSWLSSPAAIPNRPLVSSSHMQQPTTDTMARANALGLRGRLGVHVNDKWRQGEPTREQQHLMSELKREAHALRAPLSTGGMLPTALGWAADFVRDTGREIFMNPELQGAERYNAESMEMLAAWPHMCGAQAQRSRAISENDCRQTPSPR